MPCLIQALDARAEPQAKAASGHLVDVERRDREDERATGERPRDPGANPDPLGGGGEPGCLGDRAAEELGRPDAFDPGCLGIPGLGGEVVGRVGDRRDRDPTHGARRCH